jgi:isopenicillin N synthase-like dioxygenase
MSTYEYDPLHKYEKKQLSQSESEEINQLAQEMFKTNGTKGYFNIGNTEICLTRDSIHSKTIEIFQMKDSLKNNTNRINSRGKKGMKNKECQETLIGDWMSSVFTIQ